MMLAVGWMGGGGDGRGDGILFIFTLLRTMFMLICGVVNKFR